MLRRLVAQRYHFNSKRLPKGCLGQAFGTLVKKDYADNQHNDDIGKSSRYALIYLHRHIRAKTAAPITITAITIINIIANFRPYYRLYGLLVFWININVYPI